MDLSFGTISEILDGATARRHVVPADARSGSVFEEVELGGARLFVKRSSHCTDWVMRVSGDRVHRANLLWQSGLMHQLPDCLDHAVLAMQVDETTTEAVLTVVMRDVAPALVPSGDAVLPPEQHRRFIEHLAALSAHFLGWRDGLGLTTMEQRLRLFAPATIDPEVSGAAPVPQALAAADEGWRQLRTRAPVLARLLDALHRDPRLLTSLLDRTPVTFLHGDWKLGNLGSHPDGRTVLLDWSLPGSGPVCWDLCWYLALNRARLPESKEDTAERFRRALETAGVGTDGWFAEQLDLCLLGMTATFGWEKALGDDLELEWWQSRALAAQAAYQIVPGFSPPRTALPPRRTPPPFRSKTTTPEEEPHDHDEHRAPAVRGSGGAALTRTDHLDQR